MGSESRLSSANGSSSHGYVAVGTMFVDLDEYLPTKGRLLIYEVAGGKLVQRHIDSTLGSI